MRRSRFDIAAGFWLAAALAAAILRAAHAYDHGIWLVAYLLLVGAVAQALLGRGQAALLSDPPPGRLAAQAALWNAGVVLVPLGVLADVRLSVAAGSVLLLLALGSLARAARARGRRPRTAALHSALVVFMLLSVCVGYLLSGDIPWLG